MWWSGMDQDVEAYVKQCPGCAAHQNNPKAARMHPWEFSKHAWQHLHLDFVGLFLGHSFLIIVDAYSKWPEVIPMSPTISGATTAALMPVFATHGVPERACYHRQWT